MLDAFCFSLCLRSGEPYPSESYMSVMNTFVATRTPQLKTFLEKLSV